jgi:hypothetical protein
VLKSLYLLIQSNFLGILKKSEARAIKKIKRKPLFQDLYKSAAILNKNLEFYMVQLHILFLKVIKNLYD